MNAQSKMFLEVAYQEKKKKTLGILGIATVFSVMCHRCSPKDLIFCSLRDPRKETLLDTTHTNW